MLNKVQNRFCAVKVLIVFKSLKKAWLDSAGGYHNDVLRANNSEQPHWDASYFDPIFIIVQHEINERMLWMLKMCLVNVWLYSTSCISLHQNEIC